MPANRILVKLSPRVALAATEPKANLRPLYEGQIPSGYGISSQPAWFLADLPDTTGPNPWDLAHAQVAAQLGVDESAVLFAEPDLDQTFIDGSSSDTSPAGASALAGSDPCANPIPQDATSGKAAGPDVFAWHLGNEFTQLGDARQAVTFSDPRTRIAHIDTGYWPKQVAKPDRIILEHSFVEGDPDPTKAQARLAINLLPEN